MSNRLDDVTAGLITRDFIYDAAGNVISDDDGTTDQDLAYNNAGRYETLDLNSTADTDYLYNDLGERVLKQDAGAPATATHFHYDLAGRLIAESDATGAVTREYLNLNGLPLALITDPLFPDDLTFVHADHLGQPQKMTDDIQAVVWDHATRPFGETESLTGAATNNQRFPGQYADSESGYAYNYFRDYDPALGRYLQSDPIGLAGGTNTYAYVGGNPVMRVDPTGEFAIFLVPFVAPGAVTALEAALGITIGITGGLIISESDLFGERPVEIGGYCTATWTNTAHGDDGDDDAPPTSNDVSGATPTGPNDQDPNDPDRDWRHDRKLSNDELSRLRERGYTEHELKQEVVGRGQSVSRYDLFRDRTGNI